MADDAGRFEAEIDVDVTFNEFDDELGYFSEARSEPSVEKVFAETHRQNVKHTAHSAANGRDSVEFGVTESTDGVRKLTNVEEGELSGSSDDEDVEKMDCDEETDKELKTVSRKLTKSDEDLQQQKTDNFTFLSPNSVFKEYENKECLQEELVSSQPKKDCEAESAILSMESDSSMDDQSWKRHKRARLEQVTHDTDKGNSEHKKDEERKKTRGGRKKRKRSLRRHDNSKLQHRNSRFNYNNGESGNKKLFTPLKVTADDSEKAVAREIADKLNESKTMLIERVVTCIGCEKAIKLFKDTQEVERHGGMWTKEGDRRRTSGGVFLVILKHRYVTKEQSKWIFALENEILKKKAKEHQQRVTELHKKDVADLRLKLKERDKE